MTKAEEKQKRIDDRRVLIGAAAEAAKAKMVEDRKLAAWQQAQPAAELARCNAIRDRIVRTVDMLRAFCAKRANRLNVSCNPTNPGLEYPPPCVLKPVCNTCPRPMPM